MEFGSDYVFIGEDKEETEEVALEWGVSLNIPPQEKKGPTKSDAEQNNGTGDEAAPAKDTAKSAKSSSTDSEPQVGLASS